LAHSEKIALQVAEGMLHPSNLSHNMRKVEGRSTFLATRNAAIAFAKWDVTREFFLANLQGKLQEKLLRVTWPLVHFSK